MHSTSLLELLKEFRGQNVQIFVPSASAYAFGRRPNFLKWELQLRPNVKNTASVIHCCAWYKCQMYKEISNIDYQSSSSSSSWGLWLQRRKWRQWNIVLMKTINQQSTSAAHLRELPLLLPWYVMYVCTLKICMPCRQCYRGAFWPLH